MGDEPEYRSWSRKWINEKNRNARSAALAALGGKCSWIGCGWDDPRALQIDHVHGCGTKERIKHGSDYKYYQRVIKSALAQEDRYQLLCANHNWIKRVLKGEQGHAPRGSRASKKRAATKADGSVFPRSKLFVLPQRNEQIQNA